MKNTFNNILTIVLSVTIVFLSFNIVRMLKKEFQVQEDVITSQVDTMKVTPTFIEIHAKTTDGNVVITKIHNTFNVSNSGPVNWETTYRILISKAVYSVFTKYTLIDLAKNTPNVIREIKKEIDCNLEPYSNDIIYQIQSIEFLIPESPKKIWACSSVG